MSLKSPNLDDRRFSDLVDTAKLRIKQNCPGWNDLSPGDPGIVLLEAFAFLTETMIYRLNKIPDKAYVEFLRLIGVKLIPPSAAQVRLLFNMSKPQLHAVEIQKNTRVTVASSTSGNTPVFSLSESVVIPAGSTSIEANAYHCTQVEAELIGYGTGLPGLSLSVKTAPIIASTETKFDLIIGVESLSSELETHTEAIKYNNKIFRIWREVNNFSSQDNTTTVYVADRSQGTITFAPNLRRVDEAGQLQSAAEVIADIPSLNREIRAWYWSGGGAFGNVLANTLTVLKDPVAGGGVTVTNLSPATGGRDGETLQNALVRGPQELHSLSRAVTARDFELIAIQSSGAVNRAKAFTQAKLWTHATPGTVEVTLVPELIAEDDNLFKITPEKLKSLQQDSVRCQIRHALDIRRPLGTRCDVNWANYKRISIKAKIAIQREEDAQKVKQRVLYELSQKLCPVKHSALNLSPWPFGQSLKAWDVYKIISSEPAVMSVEAMKMVVDDVPDANVKDICADFFQPDTWYTGCNDKFFRSNNNGDSWELIANFDGEKIRHINAFPSEANTGVNHPGLLAVVTQLEEHTSSVHVSKDCGQTWLNAQQLQFQIDDFAWLDREGQAYLLLATEKGLFELSLSEDAVPAPIIVDVKQPESGFRAITVSAFPAGRTFVAVAGYENTGVFLSADSGKSKSFENIGLAGELIEVLSVQHKGPHRYLWAGIAAPGSDPGKGCFRWTFSESAANPEGWKSYAKNWQAGGCRSLAFEGAMVFAASYRLGVLRLDSDALEPPWETLNASTSGLPLREVNKLETIDAVAVNRNSKVIMAAGVFGVYRSINIGLNYAKCSQKEFNDEVKIPSNWLIYSGDHEIDIVSENETP